MVIPSNQQRDQPCSLALHVVVPAHNEARTIEAVIRDIRSVFANVSIIVVNDGSQDHTSDLARSAGAIVVDLPFNLGYGLALQTGLILAWREGSRLVLTMDADGQHKAREALELVEVVARGEADLALGSRYLPGSRCYRVPLTRRAGAWLFAQVLSLLTGTRITDPTTGFQCLGRRALGLYVRLADFPERTPDADLLFYAHRSGCRLKELPVVMYADESGDSMHGILKSFFYVPKMLTAILGMILIKTQPGIDA